MKNGIWWVLMAAALVQGVIIPPTPSEHLIFLNQNMQQHNMTNVSYVCDSVRCYNLTLTFNEIITNTTSLYVLRNNWTSIDDYPPACEGSEWYVTELGDTLTCVNANATIDNRIKSIEYNVTTIQTNGGTNATGNEIVNVQVWGDGLSWNVTEAVADPSLEIIFNVTNVLSFNQVEQHIWYSGSGGHIMRFFIWDYDDSSWELYFDTVGSASWENVVVSVPDPIPHIQNGVVQMNWSHTEEGAGSTAHVFRVDYLSAVSGFSGSTISTHDALGERDDISTNHPWGVVLYENQSALKDNVTVLKTGSNTVPYWADAGGFIAANSSINNGDVWIPGQQNTTGNAYFTGEVEMCGGDCTQKLKFINSLGLIGFLSSETLFKYVNANTMELQVCDDVSCQGYGFLRVEDVAKPDFKIGSVSGKVYVNNSITGFGDVNATGEVCDSATCISLLATNASALQVGEDVLAGNVTVLQDAEDTLTGNLTALQTGSNTVPYWIDEAGSIMSNESINEGYVNVTGNLTLSGGVLRGLDLDLNTKLGWWSSDDNFSMIVMGGGEKDSLTKNHYGVFKSQTSWDNDMRNGSQESFAIATNTNGTLTYWLDNIGKYFEIVKLGDQQTIFGRVNETYLQTNSGGLRLETDDLSKYIALVTGTVNVSADLQIESSKRLILNNDTGASRAFMYYGKGPSTAANTDIFILNVSDNYLTLGQSGDYLIFDGSRAVGTRYQPGWSLVDVRDSPTYMGTAYLFYGTRGSNNTVANDYAQITYYGDGATTPYGLRLNTGQENITFTSGGGYMDFSGDTIKNADYIYANSDVCVGATCLTSSSGCCDEIDTDLLQLHPTGAATASKIQFGYHVNEDAIGYLGFTNNVGGLEYYANHSTWQKILPATPNIYDFGSNARPWNNIYYYGGLTDTNPNGIERELEKENKNALDYRVDRVGNTLDISEAPKAVYSINPATGNVSLDVGEGVVWVHLQITELVERIKVLEDRLEILEGIK